MEKDRLLKIDNAASFQALTEALDLYVSKASDSEGNYAKVLLSEAKELQKRLVYTIPQARWRLLGKLADQDQRAAQCMITGALYLFDQSGKNPSHTDDGPLRFDPTRVIEIGLTSVSVPVCVERNNDRQSSVGVTHVGFKHLVSLLCCPPTSLGLQLWPFENFRCEFSSKAQTLVDFARMGEKDGDGMRLIANDGPWDNIQRT